MINLLDKESKKHITDERRRRLLVVFGLALIVLLVIGLISLASLYGQIWTDNYTLKQIVSQRDPQTQTELSDYNQLSAQLQKIVAQLAGDTQNLHLLTVVIDQILAAKPVGIKIFSWDLNRGDSADWILKLAGSFNQRSNLLAFVSALETNTLFAKVDSPFTNLIKDTNGNFLIVLTLANSQSHENSN